MERFFLESAGQALEDIEGSPEFQALAVAAAGKPERSMGDAVIPAEPPVWGEVRRLANGLLQDPPHLAVLIYLAKAEANVNSFSGLYDTLVLMREKLTEFWDSVQPLADEDDPDDAYYERINLLHELSGDRDFLDGISRLSLVEARGIGSFSSRDILISRGKLSAPDEDVVRCQEGLIRGAFQESSLEDLQATGAAITAIPGECSALESLFAEKAGTENPLSLSGLSELVGQVRSQFFETAGALLEDPEPEATVVEETSAEHSAATVRAPQGSLASRESVAQAFDRIIDYYLAAEPSSPLPILAVRAREMVPKTFFQAMQELAPEHQADFHSLVKAVIGDPLSFLVQDSYRMFMSGELIVSSTSGLSAEPESGDTAQDSCADYAETTEVPDSAEQPEPATDVVDGEEISSDSPAENETQITENNDSVAADTSAGPPTSLNPKASRDTTVQSLHSRAEVLDLLGNIDLYFSQHEPSSPVPLVVGEMRKLVSKNFAELIEEFSNAMKIEIDDVE